MKRSASEAGLDAADEEETRCPICLEDWTPNVSKTFLYCCCKQICSPCYRQYVDHFDKEQYLREMFGDPDIEERCPLCRTRFPYSEAVREALANLRRHVEAGKPAAICHLARHYAGTTRGLGLKRSKKMAAQLFRRAADLGSAEAMNNLACLYEIGKGVKFDPKTALEYWRMAADRGCMLAQCTLGKCNEYGFYGLSKDYAAAARFYALAAERGYLPALYAMGRMYDVGGYGLARDEEEAMRYYRRAAAQRNESGGSSPWALLRVICDSGSDDWMALCALSSLERLEDRIRIRGRWNFLRGACLVAAGEAVARLTRVIPPGPLAAAAGDAAAAAALTAAHAAARVLPPAGAVVRRLVGARIAALAFSAV